MTRMAIDDPYATLRAQICRTVFDSPAQSAVELRRAAARGAGLPNDLQALVDKIHRHAYRVTDDDVARLRAAHGDDPLFEIIVSAALGASRKRLQAGLEALDKA